MKRHQLEHIIRASAQIADDSEVVIVGSQAILAQYATAPGDLLKSMEADVFPKNFPERADLIEGAMGPDSMFHSTFGYCAEGLMDFRPTFPAGWEGRLIPVRNQNTLGFTGWCAELHDVVISKLVAGRDKDLRYARTAAKHGLIQRQVIDERLAMTPLDE